MHEQEEVDRMRLSQHGMQKPENKGIQDFIVSLQLKMQKYAAVSA
ncbi:hypothetical protein ACO0LD_25630 [Undibacterium sp. Ji83W]